MDTNGLIKELRDERERIIQAIASLELLAASRGTRKRGRPPKWMVEARKQQETRRGRGRPISA